MMADGKMIGDGSWELHIQVTDPKVERSLKVKSDLHIGGVMLRLVEGLDIAIDWSDHALWWPKKNMWLTHTRLTLDQYGVGAAASLHFTPMHKTLRVQLPDLRFIDVKVDFSKKTFNAVVLLCKELGIRYPEELSFRKPLEPDDLKYNYSERQMKKKSANTVSTSSSGGGVISGGIKNGTPADTNSFIANRSANSPNGSLDRSHHPHSHPATPTRTPISSPGGNWRGTPNPSTPGLHDLPALDLTSSPATPSEEARGKLLRPKSHLEKARMNVAWLDSSLSIMEQGVRELDTLLLRFKFLTFYDLNPKYDLTRINLIYEQARWCILTEEVDCTEEEMLMFAALQLQVTLKMMEPQTNTTNDGGDDIDRELSELEKALEGTSINSNTNSNLTHVPRLEGSLKFMKPRRFTLKGLKTYHLVCKDLFLYLYKTSNTENEEPLEEINLRGCEVTPDLILSQERYGIKLEVPMPDGMVDYIIRCSTEEEYCEWMAALDLASKGRSLADSQFRTEVAAIRERLSIQHPAAAPAIAPHAHDIQPNLFLAPRFLRRIRSKKGICGNTYPEKSAEQRIREAHGNVKDLSLIEAKLQYIRAWQALPDFGVALFLVKYMGHKKEELLGVTFNRIMRMEPGTGDHIKNWRFSTMKAWNVNWETRHMMIQFEKDSVIFSCLTADCKVVHEFIGGYIFLSMRTKDANQNLNEELFHKLTGGWV